MTVASKKQYLVTKMAECFQKGASAQTFYVFTAFTAENEPSLVESQRL